MSTEGHLCHFCSEIYGDEDALWTHVNDSHSESFVHCGGHQEEDSALVDVEHPVPEEISMPTFQRLSKNEKKVFKYGKVRRKAPRKLFFCDKCDYETDVKNCLKNHKLTHTHDCPYCHFKTVRPRILTEHMKTVHAVVLEDTAEEAELTDPVAETIQSLDTNGNDKKIRWDYDPFILGDIETSAVVAADDTLGAEPNLDFSYIENLSRPRLITRNDEDVILMSRAYNYLASLGLIVAVPAE